jgi:hypothetical protein
MTDSKRSGNLFTQQAAGIKPAVIKLKQYPTHRSLLRCTFVDAFMCPTFRFQRKPSALQRAIGAVAAVFDSFSGTKHGKQPDVEAFNGSRFKSPKRSRTFDPLDDWTGKRESSGRSRGRSNRSNDSSVSASRSSRQEKLCRCHDLSVDEILNFMALIDQIPTHHPLVGSH